MVTVEDAQRVATDVARPSWDKGTFMIAEVFEDEDYYAVVFGAREWFIDGDESFIRIGDWPVFVDKETGESVIPQGVTGILDVLDYLDHMTEVINWFKDSPEQ